MNVLSKWYWIMPMLVLWDMELTPNQKLLYCLISSLCAEKWYCRASNKSLWDKLWLKERAISTWVKVLIDKWYIYSDIDKSKGNERHLTMADNPVRKEQYKEQPLIEEEKPKEEKNNHKEEMNQMYEMYKTVSPKCKLTDRVKRAINGFLNEWYTIDDFKAWFDKYYKLLYEKDESWNKKYYWTYIFDFHSFVSQSNWVRKFIEIQSLDSYLKSNGWTKWDKQCKVQYDHSHYSWTEIVM